MRQIAFINEKGGTSKTTLAVHIAAHFASVGRLTALVDMDPQGHVTKSLGVCLPPNAPSLLDTLTGQQTDLNPVLLPSRIPNLWLAPSDKRLADFTLNIALNPDRHLRLANSLETLTGFDTVIIDSPPSLGMSTINILMASTEVVVPVPLHFLGLDGCTQVIRTIHRFHKAFGRRQPSIRAFVPVMFRDTPRQIRLLSKLREHFGPRVSQAVVPYDDIIDLAQGRGLTAFELAPKTPGAEGLRAVAKEIAHSSS